MSIDIRRIYFDKTLGNKLLVVLFEGFTTLSSIEHDIAIFPVLFERSRESFDVLELPLSAYAQDFEESSVFRVNPETRELEFSYPNPNEPEAPQKFVKPLTDQIEEVRNDMDTAILELTMVIAMQGGNM